MNGSAPVGSDHLAGRGGRDGVLSVLVCRGCCCGQQGGIDHDRHLADLTVATERAGGRLRVTNCIGPCDQKNVVVVRTRAPMGRWSARYLASIDDDAAEALCEWLPDAAASPIPMTLIDRQFRWPLPRAELLARAALRS